ncbi:hypothetical protein SAMN04487895_1279 [Paenibacillus sophorae]|uniref:Uncharacterized protein n=1 Tax=Paenibacillus sophorae TaxID=1333845 RepID=A0A1H8VR55_9BACL|nr:hypothetical protein SAMN04487895_1279 [Paenibacillus sophorae]
MKVEVSSLMAAIGIISGVILGWLGRASATKKDTEQRASSGAAIRSDMDYIKKGVDDIRVDVRVQGERTNALAERVTRVEEASIQANKRLDKLEE